MFCVSGEARKVWQGVTGVISVTSSLHLSALHWLSLSSWNMCPVLLCHNYHNLKLVTRYNLWPNYSQYQFSVLFLTFFLMTLWTKVSFNWYTGCKDVRRMMQCCPITKSVAFLSAVFCPVTLFVAVAESRLSVRISANFSQDGEICEQQQEDGQTTCPHWDSTAARCSGLCKSAMTVLSLSLCRTLQHRVKVFLLCQSTELQNVLNTS